MFKDYRKESRKNYGRETPEFEGVNLEQLNAGSLMRIADATEAMSKNYTQLQSRCDMYERWWNEACDENKQLRRRINAMKGVITKLRAKPEHGEG